MPTLGDAILIGSGGTTGLNTPPPYGTVKGGVVVGSSPTAATAFVGHAGELAEEVGDGAYKFTGKTAMKDRTYLVGGTLYTYSGTAFVALQGVDADLTALAGLTSAADKVPYFTGAGTADVATFTEYGRTLVACADAAAAQTAIDVATLVGSLVSAAVPASAGAAKEVMLITSEAGAGEGIAAPAAVDGNYKLRATWSGTGTTLTYAWVSE